MKQKQDSPIYRETDLANKVCIPTETADYVLTLEEQHKLLSFEFQHGSSFIVDERLNAKQILRLIQIIASLVTIEKK
jgi:hypothetical protein